MAEATSSAQAGAEERPSLIKRASLFRTRQQFQTQEAQFLLSYYCVLVIVAIDFMGLTIQNPLLPYYVKEFPDAKSMGIGTATSFLMFSYALSQLIATPLFGFGSDRFGRRPMFLLSLIGSGLGFFAQGFANSLLQLCILRFVTGLFSASRPVALAYIGDTVPPEQQPKYVAGIALGVSTSMFLGPVLGGSMGLVSLSLPCFFQAGAAAAVFLVALRYLKEPRRVNTGSTVRPTGSSATARPYKRWLVMNAVVGGMMMFSMTSWQTILPVYASGKLELNQNEIGLLFGCCGLTMALAQFAIFVPLSQKVSLQVLGFVGIPIFAVTAAVPLLDGKVWFVILVCFLQGVGLSMVMPGVSMTVNLITPPDRRGAMVSLTVTWQALMRVIAPLVVGPLYDSQIRLPFVAMIGTLAIAWVVEGFLICRIPKLKKAPAGEQRKEGEHVPKEEKDEEAERQAILRNLYNVHDDLTAALQAWSEKRRCLLAGQSPEELGLHSEDAKVPQPTQEQKHEFGVWLADMLWAHGYKRWPEHLDLCKCMCQNSFPKIREVSETNRIQRLEDIEHILQSHLMLEQQWEHFVLAGAVVPLAPAEFDWEAVSNLETLSRSASKDGTEREETKQRENSCV